MDKFKVPWQTERGLLVKAEERIDYSYGFNPEKRPLKEHIQFGVINLDKTAGPSSHEVTAWVKRIVGFRHAGHGGTLEVSFEPRKSQSDRNPAYCIRRCYKSDSSTLTRW